MDAAAASEQSKPSFPAEPDACLSLGDAREADGIIRTHVAGCRDL